jgi:hypothetical protein
VTQQPRSSIHKGVTIGRKPKNIGKNTKTYTYFLKQWAQGRVEMNLTNLEHLNLCSKCKQMNSREEQGQFLHRNK